MIGIGCFLGVAGLGLAGFAAYRWLPAGLIGSLNPLGDSHESVLRRLNDIASNMAGVLDSIQDDSGRTEAIGKLQALSNEARDLQHRASHLGEVDEQEFTRLTSQFNSDATATKERLRTSIANLRQRNLLSDELSKLSVDIAIAMEDVGMAIKIGWKKLPAPQNKAEELVRKKVEVRRDIWREFAAVTSKDHYDKLPDRLASIPGRYQQLRDLQQEVNKQGPSTENFVTKYSSVWFDASFQTADLRNKQEVLYGSNPALQAQMDAIKKAESELSGMQMLAQSQQHNGMPMPGGPPPSGFPSDPPPIPKSKEEAFSQSFNQFTQRHGAENTVILRINSSVNLQSQAGDIVDQVTAIQANEFGLKLKNYFANHDGNSTTIVLMYKGTIDDVVSRINFGKVVSFSAQKREIVVDYAD